MPIRKVKGSYRWGTKGKIYRSRAKARAQGIAILISQNKIKVKSKNAIRRKIWKS